MTGLPANPPRNLLGPTSAGPRWYVRLGIALGVLVTFITLGTVGYRVLQSEYSWLEALYMTLITVTTVGFGEVHPLTPVGRVWTLVLIVGGVITNATVLSLIVATIVEGRVRNILGRHSVEKEIAGKSSHVILCGYGRMGSLVAEDIRQVGREVVVIDNDAERIATAERAGILAVLGDAQEEETLRAAGVERAAVLVATLRDDADNVFVTLSARQLNPSLRIISRAQQAATESMLRKAGANRVICPQIIGASRMADVITRPAVVDFVEMANKGVELEMDQLQLREGSPLVGRTLRELELPKRTGAVVVAILRASGQTVYHPHPDLELTAGDTIVLVGKKGAASAVQQLQIEAGPRPGKTYRNTGKGDRA